MLNLEGYLGWERSLANSTTKTKDQSIKDLPEIPEHSFFYRNMDEPEGQIGKV
jgi:hypothetical protein